MSEYYATLYLCRAIAARLYINSNAFTDIQKQLCFGYFFVIDNRNDCGLIFSL